MDQMWSPWRSEHIEQVAKPGTPSEEGRSIFTRLAEETQDEKNLILWRGRHVFVIMNRYPYNNGHVMIVPFRQVSAYEDLTREEQEAIAHTIQRCIDWLRPTLNPEGFNVGMNLGLAAGAGIPDHLHVHVVPRWRGDTNFMPTLGEVKVIPEALHTTYARIRGVIEAAATHKAPV